MVDGVSAPNTDGARSPSPGCSKSRLAQAYSAYGRSKFTPLMQRNAAPDLPHFGKQFVCHGPSGILTFRIDLQQHTHDGLVMVGGICIDGSETYETGHTAIAVAAF